MKKQRFITACLILFCLTPGVAGSFAQTLTMETTSDGTTPNDQFAPGEYVVLNIELDNPTRVAGCAFTLNYDTRYIEAPYQVTSSVFSFTYTDVGGTHSEIMHRENMEADPAGGKINIIGANIGADGGSPYSAGPLVIFTLAFELKEGTPVDTVIEFSINPTFLTNPTAGYEGETKPVLVGALGSGDAGFGGASLVDDFPVLLDGNWAGANCQITVIPAKYIISGIVRYSGSKTGTLYVTAYQDADFSIPASDVDNIVYTWDESAGGEMNYAMYAPNGAYYLATYLDTDGSGDMHELEPQASVGPIAIADADYASSADLVLSSFTLDIDGNGEAEPLFDGVLLIRYLLGYSQTRGDNWIDGAVNTNGFRTTAPEIEDYIESNLNYFDIDGSGGAPRAYLDGFLVIRYLMEYHVSQGPSWITNAYDPAGTRATAADIEHYIELMKP